ncbi:MAG: CobW family GTP-binding protein [Acidimicrobiales bacterium]
MTRYQEPEFLPWDGRRVPLTLVGGYLGAGKTTAINEVLALTDRPIAVIVNDVGAINIDAALIRRRHGDTIELTDGCVCCSSIDDLGAAFDQIRARPEAPDQVIVELSGVAEPAQLVHWGRSAGFRLDGVIVTAAADQLTGTAELPAWVTSRIEQQIAEADLLILTKTDTVDATTADMARARLADLAPATPVLDTGADTIGPDTAARFLSLGGRRPGGPAAVPDPTLFDSHAVSTVAAPDDLRLAEIDRWIDAVCRTGHGTVVRIKGMVDTIDAGPMLIQVVGRRRQVTPVPRPERLPTTDLAVISLR